MTLLDYYYEGNYERDEGERQRDAAFDLFQRCRPALVRALKRAFVTHLVAHGPNSTDPLHTLVPLPPEIDRRVIGYVARSLAHDDGITRRVGSTKTARKTSHRRHIELWATPDVAKARVWLDSHPDYTT